jgi:hypothetical protein
VNVSEILTGSRRRMFGTVALSFDTACGDAVDVPEYWT